MSIFFPFLFLVSLITMIVFFIKSYKQKKAEEDNSKSKKMAFIFLGCFTLFFILTGITALNTKKDDKAKLKKDFNKSLGDTSPTWCKSVINDTTGNWRELIVYSSKSIDKDLAVAYSNAYFESDQEVHIIVNLYLKTTTVINKYGNTLFVTCHEYQDKEEHDAKKLAGGMVLGEFMINLDTGETEKLV